jgi:hypothetical protein
MGTRQLYWILTGPSLAVRETLETVTHSEVNFRNHDVFKLLQCALDRISWSLPVRVRVLKNNLFFQLSQWARSPGVRWSVLPLLELLSHYSAKTTAKRKRRAESVATLPPFRPIEGQKWFDRISSQ